MPFQYSFTGIKPKQVMVLGLMHLKELMVFSEFILKVRCSNQVCLTVGWHATDKHVQFSYLGTLDYQNDVLSTSFYIRN